MGFLLQEREHKSSRNNSLYGGSEQLWEKWRLSETSFHQEGGARGSKCIETGERELNPENQSIPV